MATQVLVVAEAIRDAIVAGRLRAGDRIKEVPLAAQLGVSRAPIRDALRILQAEGLVEILPNRGAIVPAVHAADVFEVYVLRASLGSLALHKLMLGEDRRAHRELESALRKFERAVARGDDRRAADADLAFQDAIVRGADMPRLAREFERLSWHVRMFIATLDLRFADQLATMLQEVEQLFAAIVAGDEAVAQRLWREKFERWMRHIVDRLPQDEHLDAAMWVALTSGPRA